jgi:hypothetical protein
MNYDTYTVIKNAKIAIERAEEMKKLVKLDLQKEKQQKQQNKMTEKQSRDTNPILWEAIDDINYKLNIIIDKLNI